MKKIILLLLIMSTFLISACENIPNEIEIREGAKELGSKPVETVKV